MVIKTYLQKCHQSVKEARIGEKHFGIKEQNNVDTEMRCLSGQIKNLTETVSRLLGKNDQLNSKLVVCKNVNKHLEEKVSKLEKA